MKITSVRYGLTANLGNYDSERLDLEAQVEEGEDWEVVLGALKSYAFERVKIDQKHNTALAKVRRTLKQYEDTKQQIKKLESKWEQAKSICAAHGINLDEIQFPSVSENADSDSERQQLDAIPY